MVGSEAGLVFSVGMVLGGWGQSSSETAGGGVLLERRLIVMTSKQVLISLGLLNFFPVDQFVSWTWFDVADKCLLLGEWVFSGYFVPFKGLLVILD